MSIQSKLEEVERLLCDAHKEPASPSETKLLLEIIETVISLSKALTDPHKAWLDEIDKAWWNFVAKDNGILRFAASIAAGELRKYAERYKINKCHNSTLWQQIADLDAIAEGGGE